MTLRCRSHALCPGAHVPHSLAGSHATATCGRAAQDRIVSAIESADHTGRHVGRDVAVEEQVQLVMGKLKHVLERLDHEALTAWVGHCKQVVYQQVRIAMAGVGGESRLSARVGSQITDFEAQLAEALQIKLDELDQGHEVDVAALGAHFYRRLGELGKGLARKYARQGLAARSAYETMGRPLKTLWNAWAIPKAKLMRDTTELEYLLNQVSTRAAKRRRPALRMPRLVQ